MRGLNVILKYKGEGKVEPRLGNSLARKGGIFAFLGGSSSSASGAGGTGAGSDSSDLDFMTNCSLIEDIYSSISA